MSNHDASHIFFKKVSNILYPNRAEKMAGEIVAGDVFLVLVSGLIGGFVHCALQGEFT